ncbi:TIGR02444 family protein [Pseudaminobacter sp. 19-2017]|uniref:TIGR02444 family protein n=1 Tax=Pseudaminobacter soli (ex Zhang et al. 2022) TaxID=2831468 RepID=A0A942E877_9HYPH|nr:TIGR02444 family protein [Pseudaminobacter soli]MBS3650217.1 TIGR02444 family protein [Pseudaminobacter soli]
MTAFPAHPAWDFVTRLYGAPGIAPACLELQERHGIDVTFMLFCLWRGSVCGRPLGDHMPAIATAAREWHQAVVLPVRAARRRLKPDVDAPKRPEAAALYKTVLSAEIDCEHAELLMLADRTDALCGSADGAGSAAAMAENLAGFFRASGVELTSRDRPALTAILEAAGAASELARLFP